MNIEQPECSGCALWQAQLAQAKRQADEAKTRSLRVINQMQDTQAQDRLEIRRLKAERDKYRRVVDAYLCGLSAKRRAADLRDYLNHAPANDPAWHTFPPIADALEALDDA